MKKPTVRQCSSGEWSAQLKVRIKGYPTQTKSFRNFNKKAAINLCLDWDRDIRDRMSKGLDIDADPTYTLSFKDAANNEIQAYKSRIINKKYSEKKINKVIRERARNYQRMIDGDLAQWGGYDISKISHTMVLKMMKNYSDSYMRANGKQNSPDTTRKFLQWISSIYKQAKHDYPSLKHVESPETNIRREYVDTVDNGRMTIEDMEQLKNCCDEIDRLEAEGIPPKIEGKRWYRLPENYYHVIVVARETGVRCGEITNIRMDSIDLDNRFFKLLHGTTKNNEGRVIPITDECLNSFQILMASNVDRRQERLTFTGVEYLLPYCDGTVSHCFTQVRRVAGMSDDLKFKFSRKEAATNLSRVIGVDDTMQITGHKTKQILYGYIQADGLTPDQVIAKMRLAEKAGVINQPSTSQS